MKEQNLNEQTKFIPIIQGSNVIQLIINDETLDLKEQIDLKEFTEKLLPLLQKLEKYINLEGISVPNTSKFIVTKVWNQDKLEQFISSLTLIQQEILWIVFQKKRIERSKLLKEFNKIIIPKISIKKFAAEVAGMTRKWNQKKYEPLFLIQRDEYVFNHKFSTIIPYAVKQIACIELGWTIESIFQKYELSFGERQIINDEEGMAFIFNYDKIIKEQEDAMLSFRLLNNDPPIDDRKPLINFNPKLEEIKNVLIVGLKKNGYKIIESKIIETDTETVYIRVKKIFKFDILLG